MEGEDPEKPKKEEDELTISSAQEESSVRDRAASDTPVSKLASVQKDIQSSALFDVNQKSSVAIRSGGTEASFSKKLAPSAPEESQEPGEVRPIKQVTGEKFAGVSQTKSYPVNFLSNRSPFIHNPPQPEERRLRIQNPRTPKEYIINLREDLADFQESHGLPRTRDYSFVSLGLALAQETVRAIYSVFLMFAELFPILAIVSLILRFALDKLIEILETTDPVSKLKKSIIFALEMLIILIPLWILIGTIVLPLMSLIFCVFKRLFRLKGGKKKSQPKPKIKPKAKPEMCGLFKF